MSFGAVLRHGAMKIGFLTWLLQNVQQRLIGGNFCCKAVLTRVHGASAAALPITVLQSSVSPLPDHFTALALLISVVSFEFNLKFEAGSTFSYNLQSRGDFLLSQVGHVSVVSDILDT